MVISFFINFLRQKKAFPKHLPTYVSYQKPYAYWLFENEEEETFKRELGKKIFNQKNPPDTCVGYCVKICKFGSMSEHFHRSHNNNLLLYHLVCPIKYRRKVFDEDVSNTLKSVYLELSSRYGLHFSEIGYDVDHVHFLILELNLTKWLSPMQKNWGFNIFNFNAIIDANTSVANT